MKGEWQWKGNGNEREIEVLEMRKNNRKIKNEFQKIGEDTKRKKGKN